MDDEKKRRLDRMNAAKAAKREAGGVIDYSHANPLDMARANPKSKAWAIAAKCYDCCYDDKSGLGAWRQQVTACAITTCPLHSVRPTSRPRSSSK